MSTAAPNPTAVQDPIPLVDLKAQYRTIASEVQEAIQESLERGDFVLGRAVEEFEKEFASYCGATAAVGVGSGTEALHIACRAAGIGPGDEVIVPAYTFIATALGVIHAGARPVLVDVNPEDGLIDPARIEDAISSRTKAILPVHMFGQCADMDGVIGMARVHGLTVIEDAAQAHGARYCDQRAGSIGDLGCFSFYPGKNLGAYGDGGAVVTSNPEFAKELRCLRNLGSPAKHVHTEIGLNSRLDTIQAAVLRKKLPHLDDWNEARRRIAASYDEALANHPGIDTPKNHPERQHVYHLYVLNCQDRDARLEELQAQGIGAGIHYPRALHEHPALSDLGYRLGDFPCAEEFAATCLSLPIFAELSERQFRRVVDAIR